MDGVVIYRVDLERPAVSAMDSRPRCRRRPRHLRFFSGWQVHLPAERIVAVGHHVCREPQSGTARLLATVPALSEEAKAKEAFNSAAEILVHPSGRFVYSSNRGHDSVTVYRADPATSALSVIQVQPVRGAFPRNINLAPGGGWLLAAGADSNTVSVHRVHPATGELTYQTKGVINVPAPICILFVPKS
jgi:6-phosphogluconolactonase